MTAPATALPTTAMERLADALRGHGKAVRATGRAVAQAQCPAHEDRNPSLSLRQIEGKVLLHCHGGCEPGAVLAELGLTLADLFDDPRGETYSYLDAAGSLSRLVRRTPGKQFKQPKIMGPPILYRLPAVLDAVKAGRTVYLVEGEKDVHALESLGVTATTAPQGAGNVGKVDPEPLRGADVVAVVDRDTAGDGWAEQVRELLTPVAGRVTFVRARTGKDAADHVAAGYGIDDLQPYEPAQAVEDGTRRLVLTPASKIRLRRVQWLWDKRLALGTLALLAGREGLGKSTLAYWVAARISRGELPGQYQGTPRGVLVCATEDSWEHTIGPRLVAAGADLDRVYRVDVETGAGVHSALSLPRDLQAVEDAAEHVDAALLLLDPLMSRLDGKLDTHRDGEVRQALEPLAAVADRAGMTVLGLIHHNKSASTDPLQLVMASKAFTAVARSVHTVIPDPEDETDLRRLFGTPKNNLGSLDLPTLAFTIASTRVDTDDGPAWTGRVEWAGEVAGSLADAMRRGTQDTEVRSAVAEATAWLEDYVTAAGGRVKSADAKRDAKKEDHSADALKRARANLGLDVESSGFPRVTYWSLPVGAGSSPSAPVGASPSAQLEQQSEQAPRGDSPTALTDSLLHQLSTSAPVGAVGAVGARHGDHAPTGAPTGARPCVVCEGAVTAWRAQRGRKTCNAHDHLDPAGRMERVS